MRAPVGDVERGRAVMACYYGAFCQPVGEVQPRPCSNGIVLRCIADLLERSSQERRGQNCSSPRLRSRRERERERRAVSACWNCSSQLVREKNCVLELQCVCVSLCVCVCVWRCEVVGACYCSACLAERATAPSATMPSATMPSGS
jgi:hypothetical protein